LQNFQQKCLINVEWFAIGCLIFSTATSQILSPCDVFTRNYLSCTCYGTWSMCMHS